MLTQIRDKIIGPIGLVILAVIAVSFVFFGATLSFVGNIYAAKVDGVEIGVGQFENNFQTQMAANPQLASLPPEFRGQLRRSVLEAMIREQLVDNYLDDAGYRISEVQLTEAIQQFPEFQVDGQFDMATAESILLQNGLTTAQFRALQRTQLRNEQLRRAIGGTSIVTPAEFRRYLNLVAEQRLVATARFDLASVTEGLEVSPDEINAYYDANELLYQLPESASVAYLEIDRSALAENVEVAEETLVNYYEESQGRYLQDEQRRARHILILAEDDRAAAEETARSLVARIDAGEPFADLAATYSKDGTTASQGGDLGVRTREQLSEELGSAVFAMAEGELSGPIESEFGFHVIRLDEILERGSLPLEQVRGELLAELRQQETDGLYRDLARAASDALFDTEDLAEIAASVGLEVQTAKDIRRDNAGPFGTNQIAIDAIFAPEVLQDGRISEVIELDANTSAMFKVEAYTPASRRPLDEVIADVTDAVRIQKAQAIVTERATELMTTLESGEDFGIAAESAGATVEPVSLVARQGGQIDQNVLAEVFAAPKPSQDQPTFGMVTDMTGGQTLFSLQAVIPGRPESIPLAERDARKDQLELQAGGAEYLAFVESLYNDANIAINEDVVTGTGLLQ